MRRQPPWRGCGPDRRPERIGVQALAEALVPGNGYFDQFPSARPPVAQFPRDLDQRTGERIAWHDHLLLNTLAGAFPGEGDALDLDAVAVAELQCAGGAGRRVDR